MEEDTPVDLDELRDYFAAFALQGICSHPDSWGLTRGEIPAVAYSLADGVLTERAKLLMERS